MRTKLKWASLGLAVSSLVALSALGVAAFDPEDGLASDDGIADEAPTFADAPGHGPTPTPTPTPTEAELVAGPSDQVRVLRAPGLDEDWELVDVEPPVDPTAIDGLVATSYHFAGEIYEAPSERHDVLGFSRRGIPLEVARRVGGRGCPNGTWYEVEPRGYVCTTLGFTVGPRIDARGHFFHEADLDGTRPFRYAKVIDEGAPRFYRLPSEDELSRAEAARAEGLSPPDIVATEMKGVYLLALTDQVEERAGKRFVRTVRDRWVDVEDVEDKPLVTFHGERITRRDELPLAFVFLEDRDLFERDGDGYRRVGIAEKGARFRVASEREADGVCWVEREDGLAVRRDAVRIVRPIRRPADRIPGGVKWIHVDLSEQTLVAYEGDRPVLATLVSSGKEGHDTPVGTWRIREKHASVTMNGDDPLDGFYEVEEVPWTMYYWNSFALHGAYWHEGFGQVRSHGCTNLPPADARFLYHWTTPRVPRGWYALRRSQGTYVHFTR